MNKKRIFKPSFYYWKIKKPTFNYSISRNSVSIAIYKFCIGLGWFWFPENNLMKEPLD